MSVSSTKQKSLVAKQINKRSISECGPLLKPWVSHSVRQETVGHFAKVLLPLHFWRLAFLCCHPSLSATAHCRSHLQGLQRSACLHPGSGAAQRPRTRSPCQNRHKKKRKKVSLTWPFLCCLCVSLCDGYEQQVTDSWFQALILSSAEAASNRRVKWSKNGAFFPLVNPAASWAFLKAWGSDKSFMKQVLHQLAVTLSWSAGFPGHSAWTLSSHLCQWRCCYTHSCLRPGERNVHQAAGSNTLRCCKNWESFKNPVQCKSWLCTSESPSVVLRKNMRVVTSLESQQK